MTEKPAKPTKAAKTVKPKSAKPKSAKTAKSTSAVSRESTLRRRRPSHDEIAERAYFIYVEEGGPDQLGNWLRAERELTMA